MYRKGRHLLPVTVVFCTGKDGRWRLLPALLVDEGAPYEAARELRVVAGAEAVEILLRRMSGQPGEEAERANRGVTANVGDAPFECLLQLGLGKFIPSSFLGMVFCR